MKKAAWVLFLVIASGCTTQSKVEESSSTTPAVSAPPAPAEIVDENQSKVLNKNKKCPRNSKVVNGKCTLQVESND